MVIKYLNHYNNKSYRWLSICFLLLVFSSYSLAENEEFNCDKPLSTIEVNYCASVILELAKNELTLYLNTVYLHHNDDQILVDAIKQAQNAWENYSTFHCESVYTQWRDGSIRGIMAISCQTELTKQRTHDVWNNFLTYMDNSTPVLPEPPK